MKTGISAWSFVRSLNSGVMSLKGFLEFCAENNVHYVELLDCFLEDKQDYKEVKSWLSSLGLSVSSYSIGNDFINCNSVQDEIERVKKGVDSAVFFDAPCVRVFGGDLQEGSTPEKCSSLIVDSFLQCIKYAEDRNITLVLENHGLLIGKSGQVKDIIGRVNSSHFKVTADTGNFMLVNENPLDAVGSLADYIGFVHFKDMKQDESGEYAALDDTRYTGTVLGQGSIPLAKIVDTLKENGYSGHISIEYEGTGDEKGEVLQSWNYLQSIM